MRKILFSVFFFFLGLKRSPVAKGEQGTIVILIDGLSFDALALAIQKKYCPTLKKLSKTHAIREYYCGVPSSTTATEALLFYGSNYNIPGFTWYDRTLKQFVRGNRSKELSSFEDMYPKKRELFKEGSVIMAVYTGGASELSISGRNLTLLHPLSIIKKIGYLLISLLYPIQLIRTLYLSLKTLLLYSQSTAHSTKETFSKLTLGQFSCFLTEIEVMRNTKKIFVDFLLYDEFAHTYGPTHPNTLSTLRLIDRYVGRILSSARNAKRSYSLIILSDHGQTASHPIDFPFEKSTSCIENALQDKSYSVQKTYGTSVSSPQNKIVYCVPAGSSLQIYFSPHLDAPLYEADIAAKFPHCIPNLLSVSEFGWLLLRRTKSSAILHGKNGTVEFGEDKQHHIKGNPFPNFNPQEIRRIIDSLIEYSTFPNNGDIVIFGNTTPDGGVYSFENHRGTHGGFYGAMSHPFIMSDNPRIMGNSMSSLFDTIAVSL